MVSMCRNLNPSTYVVSDFDSYCNCNAILHDSIPPDGEWDWDNYSVVYLSQKKDLPVTAMASVKFNVWCAIGNSIFVVHSHLLKMEVCVCVTLQTILCFSRTYILYGTVSLCMSEVSSSAYIC